ncbi:MAG TPA: ATP-binding protein, partial [Sandaracinaceae bacterium]
MTIRVLVVEDNLALAENIQELFAETGAEVTVCARAGEALAHLESSSFDLAIVDVQLPDGVSGVDLVPHLKRASPGGEVILATGNATLHSAIEAVRHGVFAYLEKPFDPEGLLALGERALAQVALRRERAALAAELARSEALHRAVVETVDSLIVGLDADHRVRMWNRSAAEATGWSADEILGEDARTLLIEEADRARFERAVAAAGGGESVDLSLRIRTRAGGHRVVRFRFAPLSPEGNAHPLVLAGGTDVSEQLELEARAAEAEALAAMGRLTAGLAHEIRNPPNAAKLQLEIMARAARRLDDHEAKSVIGSRVEIVKGELGRLSRLLDEFLGLARPQRLDMGPVDLGAVVDEVVALQDPVAQSAGLRIERAIGAVRPVRGDAGKLKQALVNLVVNSIEAMAERGTGTITIAAEPYGDAHVELRVEDTGPGLPDLAEDVLKPFVTTKPAGTGLGLTIVSRIVDLHGGRLHIGPRPGGGTVVRLV